MLSALKATFNVAALVMSRDPTLRGSCLSLVSVRTIAVRMDLHASAAVRMHLHTSARGLTSTTWLLALPATALLHASCMSATVPDPISARPLQHFWLPNFLAALVFGSAARFPSPGVRVRLRFPSPHVRSAPSRFLSKIGVNEQLIVAAGAGC